jgi:hypothetical protein
VGIAVIAAARTSNGRALDITASVDKPVSAIRHSPRSASSPTTSQKVDIDHQVHLDIGASDQESSDFWSVIMTFRQSIFIGNFPLLDPLAQTVCSPWFPWRNTQRPEGA